MRKRVLVVSDFHCGHEVGLTPPKWNPQFEHPVLQKASDYRSYLWERYFSIIENYAPFDIAIANGDLIDGRGERIGGTEEIFLDRGQQVEMATEILESIGAKDYYITRGTDYHTGSFENFEDGIASALGGSVGDVLRIAINGLTFNCRHYIGSSQSPVGRTAALEREDAWAALWAAKQDFDMADVLIRSHVHYYRCIQDSTNLRMTTPALQGFGGRYGTRKMSGLVDFGAVIFDVESQEDYTWKPIIFRFPSPPVLVAGRELF